jgi:hypothetical protein
MMRAGLGLRLLLVAVVLITMRQRGAAQGDPGAVAGLLPTLRPRIVNGVHTSDYPTAGALLDSANPNLARLVCSGTLIGCQTFLTAGHCVEGNLDPGSYSVFLQHAGFFTVASVALHPAYNFPAGDVAVLTLSSPVNGISPTPIDTTGAPAFGSPGTIVGFGRSGGGASNADYGLKRAGDVVTTSCTFGISDMTSVCWDFLDPVGPPGTDSDTCNGDSGGPLFVDFGTGPRVAGVTSGGDSSTCFPPDHSFDANVYTYHAWIQTQGGADLNHTSCGNLAQVGSPATTIVSSVGSLSSAVTQGTAGFNVGAATSQLRVALNAIDDGVSNFDLYVRFGSPPTTSVFDCKADGPNQYGFCQFSNPAPGTWHVLVHRASGSGSYQVTATTFGPDCSNPANDGLPCDDGNSCTSGDVCQAGACTGTAVIDGVACDDGNPCTEPDTCEAGTCIGSQAPRTGCITPFLPRRGAVKLEEDPGRPQRLSWAWTSGRMTTKNDFGTPLTNTDYDLCIYDQTAGSDHPAYHAHVTAGGMCGSRPCWKESASGYVYRDTRGLNGTVSRLVLKSGSDGRARITLNGRGDGLALPVLPLSQQSTVTVQLTNGLRCWEARFSSNSHNDSTLFKAKAD